MVGEPPDFEQLRSAMKGELRLDLDHRRQYAADESIYWIVPLAVAHPKDEADIAAVLRFAAENALGLTPRAGGTSLAGQAVGPGIILDISGRFDRVIEVDAAAHRVTAEPGVVLDALNGALAPHGQRFGPDPSSKDACQVGGMVANNASGVHHPMWGAVVDNVVSLRLMLANGEVVTTAPVRIGSEEHAAKGKGRTLEARIYRELPEIIAKYAAKMRKNWPRQEKSSSGYRLDKAVQGGVLDLSKLVCGSEGTLAIVLGATLATVDIPRAKGLLVLYFRGLEDAARGVSVALSTGPSAIEMIDERVVEALKAKAPELAARFKEDTRAALFVEYFGDDVEAVQHKMHAGWQALLSEMAGSRVPVGFVEDTAVPVEKLAEHVRGLYAIFDRYGLKAAAYGHASTGHLHVRPYLDLKDAGDRRLMERVAAEVFDQTRRLEGTMSGEHGDGLLRTEFLDSFFWETYDAMVAVKRLFDPVGILNPGKIVDGASGTMTKHLRALSERGG
jgi:FAD/FMN-containing dehydrogenase